MPKRHHWYSGELPDNSSETDMVPVSNSCFPAPRFSCVASPKKWGSDQFFVVDGQ